MLERIDYRDDRPRVVIECGKIGAKQSFKDECDVNSILARYAKTGLLTPVVSRPGIFVDVSEVGDYRTAIENVRSAEALFMEIPSGIRAEFDNDPAKFLDFCTDPASEDRMRELGLLPPLDEEVEEEVVPEVAAAVAAAEPPVVEPPEGGDEA